MMSNIRPRIELDSAHPSHVKVFIRTYNETDYVTLDTTVLSK
jgi:hypothetical protein